MREEGRGDSRSCCVHAGHLASALQSQVSMKTCMCHLYLRSSRPGDHECKANHCKDRSPVPPQERVLGSQGAKVRLVHGSLHTRLCKDSGTFLFF